MNRLMLLGFLLATATAYGSGTIQLGKPTVEDDRITVPVILGGALGGGVSAMDFHFRYNPEAVQPISVVAGAAAERADKRVMSNQRTPGEYAVVMMGFNQSACGPGEAIKIVLQRLRGPDQKWDLNLTAPTLSSVDGRLIDSQVLPSEIEPAEDGKADDEKAGLAPRLAAAGAQDPKTDPPAAQPTAVYDAGVAETPSVTPGTARNEGAAVKLSSVLESAEEARQGIRSPGAGAADAVDGTDNKTGNLEKNGIYSTSKKGGRSEVTALSGGNTSQKDLRNNTVELQSNANAWELPAGELRWGAILKWLVSAVIVFAIVAGLLWRRSRLLR